jgi:hypothetical protein
MVTTTRSRFRYVNWPSDDADGYLTPQRPTGAAFRYTAGTAPPTAATHEAGAPPGQHDSLRTAGNRPPRPEHPGRRG